jgi:predicted DNA-binding transcriptional regulator AlpA
VITSARIVVLPADGEALLRLRTVLAVYQVSLSEWKRGVKAGRYPQPVHLTPRVPAWKASDIRALMAKAASRGIATQEVTTEQLESHS